MFKDSGERSIALGTSCYISGFKSDHVHGQGVCYKQTCNSVTNVCSPSSYPNANNETACTQACINSLTCKMVAFQTTKIICKVYNCKGCTTSIFEDGNPHAVYFCSTGNERTNTCTSTFQSHCINERIFCIRDCDLCFWYFLVKLTSL